VQNCSPVAAATAELVIVTATARPLLAPPVHLQELAVFHHEVLGRHAAREVDCFSEHFTSTKMGDTVFDAEVHPFSETATQKQSPKAWAGADDYKIIGLSTPFPTLRQL